MKVITSTGPLDLVNYYCPNDKKLSLNTIQVSSSNFLINGDFNSQSQSWGYSTLDKRGEEIEAWQDENKLILINDPTDPPTFYSRRWHSTTTPDLAFCTEDVHKRLERKVGPQLGGSDHRPVLLTISAAAPVDTPQHPRWNYRKAKWGIFRIRSNELTDNIIVDGRNINNVIQDYNRGIIQAAKESIPRGVRKNYKPYWTPTLQEDHDNLTRAREDAEANPSDENHIKLQHMKAKYLKTKLESTRRCWREKTGKLNMERDSSKLWKLTKALNDEGNRQQKITLEDQGKLIINKQAANAFGTAFAYESNTTIPRKRDQDVKQEMKEKEKKMDTSLPVMQNDITKEELQKAIGKLKKRKSPGPDDITNEMLSHLGNTAQQKLLDIFNLSWKTGQVPQSWKEATMIPILKHGKNKSSPKSY